MKIRNRFENLLMTRFKLAAAALATVMTYSAVPALAADAANVNAAQIKLPQLINVGAKYVFAPPGFDNNDNVQIVVHGELPSTCYKAVHPAVRINHASRTVYVAALAYYYTGSFCLDVMVPFTQTVDLGLLSAGHYQVIETSPKGTIFRSNLPIAIAKSPLPDEVLYAPVQNASVEKLGSQANLLISGTFPSDCLELQQVRVLNRVSKIIEVLPIAVQKPGTQCRPGATPFEARVTLPRVAPGDTLIHIRSMNGRSLNLVEEL
jgi:hypothetical protein